MATKRNPEHPAAITLAIVLGVTGGMGKTLFADLLRAWSQLGGTPVQMIRMESGVRRAEFPGDIFVDLDGIADAANAEGGIAALFDSAEPVIFGACDRRELAIVDAGANAHNAILTLAGETGLPQLVQARGGRTAVFVLVSPLLDVMCQTALLIASVRERIPDALPVVVLNERTGAFKFDGRGAEGRTYAELCEAVQDLPTITLPLVGVRALTAFSAANRSIPEILEASEEDLVRWTGLTLLRALACQSHLAAWWTTVTQQLQAFPFRGSTGSQ